MEDNLRHVTAAFLSEKTAFTGLARTHHPDKTSDKAKIDIFKKKKYIYEQQKVAYDFLGRPDVSGGSYPGRIAYDQIGEALRLKFSTEFKKRYPDTSYAVRAKEITDEK